MGTKYPRSRTWGSGGLGVDSRELGEVAKGGIRP